MADRELAGLLRPVAEDVGPGERAVDALLRQSVEVHQSRRRPRALLLSELAPQPVSYTHLTLPTILLV
eukprot:4196959-Pyramimonas_sp.AAC.1